MLSFLELPVGIGELFASPESGRVESDVREAIPLGLASVPLSWR